jgi:Metallo-beta-lactamase superfamily
MDWGPEVSSFVVESEGEVVVLDPLAPRPSVEEVSSRLERRAPTAVVVLKPDHVRDVDLFLRWYDAKGYGPYLYWGGEAPKTELQPVQPDDRLPGGLRALYDGRWRLETPVYAPEQRTLVFADGMTAPDGTLRVWASPWLESCVLPALRELLELPFQHVLVSHGEPVHGRADFEAALERDPWEG